MAYDDAAKKKLASLSALEALANRIKTDYATKEEIQGLTGAEANKIDSIKINGTAITPDEKAVDITIQVNGAAATASADSKGVNISVPTTVAGLTDAGDYAKSADVDSKIKAAIGTVYTPGGSKTSEEISGEGATALLVADNVGKVFNISNTFNVDENFVEYESLGSEAKSYPAGTNIVIVDASESGDMSEIKFDALAGFIDLSGYVQATALTSTLADYVKSTDADGKYAAKTELTSYVKSDTLTTTLNDYLTTETAGTTYATKAELGSYATKTAASGDADGLMSSADKTKLDGITVAEEQDVTDMLESLFPSD